MPDFATARTTGAAGLPDAEGREVIMQDKPLAGRAAGVAVHFLFVGFRAERGQHERHGLAAREQAGPVRTGQNADFGGELAQIARAAAVGPFVFQD